MIKLAIDAMGGDNAPMEIIKGVNLALAKHKDLEVMIYGDEDEIKKYLDNQYSKRFEVFNYKDKVSMGESDPVAYIRNNKNSSLVKSFEAVKEKKADGVVTAGPTQAVVVCAHLVIKRIKGMKRTALCLKLPSLGTKNRLLLDVGANVELRSEHITQLATYASIYLSETEKKEKPLVGLVNIGSEESKGREVDIESYQALKNCSEINFYGNIEPKEIFSSNVDILVCDGYVGNIVMKTSEGVALGIGKFLKTEIKKSFLSKFGYLFMKKTFNNFKNEMNPDNIGGTMLFGVDGVLIKAHGASLGFAFSSAITQAYNYVKGDVVNKMKEVFVDNDK